MAITQTITPLPAAPDPSMSEEDFDAHATEFTAALPPLATEINALIPQINNVSSDITTRHSDVVTKHDAVMTTAQQMQINSTALQTAVNSASGSATSAASSASSAAASAAAVEVASTAEIIAGDIARQVTASALKTALQTGVNYAAKFEGVGIGRGGGGIDYNTAAGMRALHSNTTGSNNTAAGVCALYSNTTGSNNTAAGVYAGFSGNYTNAMHLGYEAQATADNECKIGNAALTAIRSSAGFYGAAFTTTSDARLKSDIANINLINALQLAKKIKWHKYTKQAGATTRQEAGVIAQELQALTREIGDFEWLVQSSDNYLTVDYTSLYAILECVNQYRFELLEG